MAAPEQLRDRSAHRVADGDDRTGAELDERRGAVVGAVGEAEDAAACAGRARGRAGRGRSRGSARPSGSNDLEPVEAAARDPAVQEQEGRCAGRPCDLADEGRAPARELDAGGRGGSGRLASLSGRYAMAVDAVRQRDTMRRGPRCRASIGRRATSADLGEHDARVRRRAAPRRGSPTRCAAPPASGVSVCVVAELGRAHRSEARAARGARVAPVLVVAPRRPLLDAVHDRPDSRRPTATLRSRAFHTRPTPPPRTHDARHLGGGAVVVEPVPRLRDDHRVERRVARTASCLRGARDAAARRAAASRNVAAHPGDRLDREQVGAGPAQQPGELARCPPRGRTTRRPGPMPRSLDEPGDAPRADTTAAPPRSRPDRRTPPPRPRAPLFERITAPGARSVDAASVGGAEDHAGGDGVVRRLVDEDERAGVAVAAVLVEEQRLRRAQRDAADLVERRATSAVFVAVQRVHVEAVVQVLHRARAPTCDVCLIAYLAPGVQLARGR